MVIANRHLCGPLWGPDKTDAPLIVDADRMLSLAVAGKRLQPISRWNDKVRKLLGSVQLKELAKSDSREISVALTTFTEPKLFSILISKRKDHRRSLPFTSSALRPQLPVLVAVETTAGPASSVLPVER